MMVLVKTAIKPKDYWLVAATVASLFLMYSNFWIIGVMLFLLTCFLILKDYGVKRVILHAGLSFVLCAPIIIGMHLLTNL